MKSLVVACAVALLAAPAAGQSASALLHEGDPLGGDGHVVDSLSNPAVNHVGGYAISLNTSDGVNTLSRIWGDAAGGAGAIIRTEHTIGDYEQASFESFWGISDSGQVSYSPSCTHIPTGTTGLDGVWLDDIVVAIEEQPYPHQAGMYWSFGSRPGVTSDGKPYFVGGITDTQGGSTQNRGLFYDMAATPLLLGGDVLPGLPFPLDTASTISFDYRFSRYGTHYLGEVQMTSGSSLNDNAMVMDGSGLILDGVLVREDNAIPASIGGLAGENWDNFDFLSVTEDGKYLITGDSSASTSVDEFVLLNGQIALREGDMLPGGAVVSGSIEGGYMNEAGDWAVTWDIAGGSLEALIVNGVLMLTEGDNVDWDGDGSVDADAFLTDFTGISTLVVGDPNVDSFFDVYFTADVDVHGEVLEGLFRMTVPEPATIGLLGFGLLPVLRRRR